MLNFHYVHTRAAALKKPCRKAGSPIGARGDAPLNRALLSAYDETKDIRRHPVFEGRHVWPPMWEWYFYRLTGPGRWFLLLTLFFALYGSSSLDLQIFVPFTYAFGFWVVACAITLVTKPRVTLKVTHGDRVGAGGTLPLTLEIRQAGRWPGAALVVIPHRLPLEIDAVPTAGIEFPLLQPGEKAVARMALVCRRRGVYTLQGFRVQTDFPLGLMRAYSVFREDRSVLVYPQFTALARLDIPQGRRYQPGGVALASHLGESLEFIGNRDFREGDNVRDINWRASARLDRPVVREYREEYFHRVGLIQDTFVPSKDREARREDFERAVSLCAAVSDYLSRQEYIVDLFAAGPDLYHLSAGRSLAFLDQVLDILACLEPGPSEPFAILEPELLESLSQITTILCLFLDWDETRRAFAARLRQASGVKVIVVRDAPCTLDPAGDAEWAGDIVLVSAERFRAGVAEL